MHANVSKVLNENGITFREIRHDSFSFAITSPMDFANALGYSLDRITKSVFLRSKSRDKYVMAVCSMSRKLNFAELATLAGAAKLEVAEKQELAELVGYPVNGVCSIGLSPAIQVFVDEALLTFPTILVGSGEAAVEIELSPADLAEISKATSTNISL
ncbi:YbaK/EbsC family protein [Mucilaginibacter corticis]|uniref:YbaK/EbsC family protein n=1 Tax=Mucilaginibacter corticis TaxID=2597670 RepID=A0A556MUC6_9SPHI|nr:YbaK/EbsC family protein [Mucilaginibacter corticis]TSJ43398.1 YbaK/EbsC family protein [Mucilaginibacter corticis]